MAPRHPLVRLSVFCVILALLLTGVVLAAPGDTERVSVTSDEAQTAGTGAGVGESAISGDGDFVAFESTAADLVPNDTNGKSDIFVRDRTTGTTSRVSVASGGAQANGDSYQPDISSDGRIVVFWSYATNLAPKDLAGPEVYIHDRVTGVTSGAGLFSAFPAISGDGRWVAFQSTANNLTPGDTNGRADIFVYDRVKDATTRVSLDSGGVQANGNSSRPDISYDGNLITFESNATNLVEGDTNGFMDIFVHDMETRATTRVSVSGAGQANNVSQYPAMDPTGRFVTFQSSANNLSPVDTGGGRDIYVHELGTGTTTLASITSSGAKLGGNNEHPAISGGGRFVAFETGGVVAGEANSYADVAVHDRQTGYTSLASVNSAGVVGNGASLRPAISTEGPYIAFWSGASNLVPGDTNDDVGDGLEDGSDFFVHQWKEPPPPAGGGSADLEITQAIVETNWLDLDPSSLMLTYEIRVTNHGPNAAGAPVVTDNLPASLSFVRCRPHPVDPNFGACQQAGNSITAGRYLLPPGASAGFRVVVKVNYWVPNGTAIDNTATVASSTGDPTPANNSATATWTTPTSTKRPLIFVPGVGGTKLVNDFGERWLAIDKMLADPEDRHLVELLLAPDGESPYSGEPWHTTVRPGDILRQEANSNIYRGTIERLQAAGYRERVDLFPFPNDWRKDLRNNGLDLLRVIDLVRAQTGADKVDILAHSQGGLITLVALENPGSIGKVNKAVTMGTPVLGAPKALGMLEYQAPCFLDELPLLGCPLKQSRLQEVFTNWPGAYALLPSRAFHQSTGSPLVVDRDTNGDGRVEGAQSYEQWSGVVRANRNPTVLAKAEALHDMVDTLDLADPTVQLRRFVGLRINTPIYVREFTWCILWFFDCRTAQEIKMGDGDGTVPRHSADLYNPKLNFDRRGASGIHTYVGVDHAGLPINDLAMRDAINFFNAFPPSTEEPPPEDLEGIELETLGPVNGHIGPDAGLNPIAAAEAPSPPAVGGVTPPANTLGRVPGQPEEIIWQTLPGGKYNEIGDTRSYFLNQPGSYTANLNMDAAGPARLRVRTYDADAIASQAVFNVDAPATARLELDMATAQDPASLRLQIDRDGNGTVEEVVAPDTVVSGAGADDETAPVTTATATGAGAGQLSVSLAAADEAGGSGVAATYVMVVGTDSAPRPYTGPFSVAAGTRVRFASVDRAGNTEAFQELAPATGNGAVYLPLVRR